MKIKRTLVLFLAFLLVFSNGVMAAGPLKASKTKPTKQITTTDEIKKEDAEKSFKKTDKVRVIVEVEGEPAITYATKKGKKFSEIKETKKVELQAKAEDTQKAVKNQLNSKKVKMEYKENFSTIFNGFSGIVEFGKLKTIEKIPGVVKVTVSNEYERPIAEPEMKYSKELIEAQKAWDDYGYNGKGMTIGIIDTGIDPSHKDMVLTASGGLSENAIQSLASTNDLPGTYHTPKVPYGYNYMDENQEILDLGPGASMHGMHVAGIAGANGDEDNGGIKGVAPEAQLLALKVFGNDPEMASTWGDIYIKAIDDAILLGADVLNMSLGSTAAFVNPDDPEQQAIENAVENGIVMSISAGNSSHLGNGFFNPYASNPDIGVVGSPGLSYDSLQVASFENSYMDMDAITYKFGDEEGQAAFMSSGSVHPDDVDEKTFGLEYAALGAPEDFEGKDFTGKYALIQRGELAFTDKALNAQAAGASGVIIYNNTDGVVNMASDPAITIPQLFMLKTDGDLLAKQLQEGVEVTVTFDGGTVTTANPLAGTMSAFTSWGVTPNLDFKPEITAPGGNIYSTLQDDQYGTMSGTSMAAPHVSGGSAIVLQRVDEDFDLEGKSRVEMAKNILMNTSKVVVDKGEAQSVIEQENPYSPRRQGAGLMQLHAALSTPVVVTEEGTGEGKVALKEVGDTISFTLEATNYTDEAVTYDADANVQTDFAFNGVLGNAYLTGVIDELEAQELVGADITLNDGKTSVKIPANGSAKIKVEIDLSEAQVLNSDGSGLTSPEEIFPNGYFVEGFVTLTDPADENPELSVPYVGFNGDWNAAPILDELAYDGNDSFYEQAGMVYDGGDDSYYYLGHDPLTDTNSTANIAISPNGDGVNDEIIPILSFLRNAKLVEYNILDEDKNLLRTVKTEHNIRKNYYDGGAGGALPYRLNPDVFWDGKVKDKQVEDGSYYFEIATTIDYDGKDAQKLQVPVIVDTVAPEVTGSLDGKTVTFEATDDRSGVAYVDILVNGETVLEEPLSGEETEFTFDKLNENAVVTVIAVDFAGNTKRAATNDTTIPVIKVATPETFGVYDTSEIQVTGTIEDASEIVEFTIEDKAVDVKWNADNGNYYFETTISFEDGVHPIHIYAKDAAGNEASLANSRLFFVDTTAPELNVDAPKYVKYETKTANIVANLKDNFDELTYKVNGSEEFSQESSEDKMVPIEEEVKTEVSLEPGKNVVKLELVDVAGNTTTKEIEIYREQSAEEEQVTRIAGNDRYDTAVEVSKQGWETADTVVLARGDDYADALAGVPLAKKYDAPLLLTQSNKLTKATKEEIARLGTKTVYLLGGEIAISKKVETELKSLGVKVNRIAGDTRDETAVKIANNLLKNEVGKKVVLVNGYNFPDALSVASYAAERGMPILVTQDKKISKATKKALLDMGVSKTLVIGGPVAISEKVVNELPNPERVAGKDRFATAVEVAKHFNVDTNKYYVTTGMEFPDALSSAALAAKEDTGVLLVGSKLPKEFSEFVKAGNIDLLSVIGGPVAVGDDILKALKDLLK